MSGSQEIQEKIQKARTFMKQHQYDVLRLQSPNIFAWITGGRRNYVDFSSTWTGAVLYITPDEVIAVLADNEKNRVIEEELQGKLVCEVRTYPWWGWADDTVSDLLQDKRIASDIGFAGMTEVSEPLRSLFYPLHPCEIDRYQQLACDASKSFWELASFIHPGMTEQQIAGKFAGILIEKDMIPVVLMVAADERAAKYKHPLPSNSVFQQYLVVSVCVSRGGLVISQTRSYHVGPVQQVLIESHYAAGRIASILTAHSIHGETYENLYQIARNSYQEVGFSEEWKNHHFGGPTGYRTREFTIGPASVGRLLSGVPLAWNPTIGGAKSEDTILVGDDKAILLGEDSRWPKLRFDVQGAAWDRPDILII